MHEGVVKAVVEAHKGFISAEDRLDLCHRHLGEEVEFLKKPLQIVDVLQFVHAQKMEIFEILHVVGGQCRAEAAADKPGVVHQHDGQLPFVARGVLQDHYRHGGEEESHADPKRHRQQHRAG